MFLSKKGRALGVPALNRMVKKWCRNIGLNENYGSHTLRKTWGFQQRTLKKTPIPLLMDAFGHSSQQQTLEYLCIQEEEIQVLYTKMVL
ncbi:MAG: tyrosine-type recombinase/integrase [Thermodesulfobacteriota bacterium]